MRATELSGLETVALSKGLKAELEGAEIKKYIYIKMDKSKTLR